MPLYFRLPDGTNEAITYYDSVADLDGFDIVDPSEAYVAVRVGSSTKYIGLVAANPSTHYAPYPGSRVRINKNGYIYALAYVSKKLDITITNQTAYTIPSNAVNARIERYSLVSGTTGAGSGGGGGGGAARAHLFCAGRMAIGGSGGSSGGEVLPANATGLQYPDLPIAAGTRIALFLGSAGSNATTISSGGSGGVHNTTYNGSTASIGGSGTSGARGFTGGSTFIRIGNTTQWNVRAEIAKYPSTGKPGESTLNGGFYIAGGGGGGGTHLLGYAGSKQIAVCSTASGGSGRTGGGAGGAGGNGGSGTSATTVGGCTANTGGSGSGCTSSSYGNSSGSGMVRIQGYLAGN